MSTYTWRDGARDGIDKAVYQQGPDYHEWLRQM